MGNNEYGWRFTLLANAPMLARSAYQSSVHFQKRTSSENLYREGFPAALQFFHTNWVPLTYK